MRQTGLALLLTATLVATSVAQPPGRSRGGRGRFGVPKEGTTLPSVKLFDEHGKEFNLKSLRGHYSVLVFGCLT